MSSKCFKSRKKHYVAILYSQWTDTKVQPSSPGSRSSLALVGCVAWSYHSSSSRCLNAGTDSGDANGSGEKKADARGPIEGKCHPDHRKGISTGCWTLGREYDEKVGSLVGIIPKKSLIFWTSMFALFQIVPYFSSVCTPQVLYRSWLPQCVMRLGNVFILLCSHKTTIGIRSMSGSTLGTRHKNTRWDRHLKPGVLPFCFLILDPKAAHSFQSLQGSSFSRALIYKTAIL